MHFFILPNGLSGKESTYQWRRCGFTPWVGKIPWRRKWQLTPVFLPGKFYGQRSPTGYSSWGRKRVGHHLVTKQWHLCVYIYIYTHTYVYICTSGFAEWPQVRWRSSCSLCSAVGEIKFALARGLHTVGTDTLHQFSLPSRHDKRGLHPGQTPQAHRGFNVLPAPAVTPFFSSPSQEAAPECKLSANDLITGHL